MFKLKALVVALAAGTAYAAPYTNPIRLQQPDPFITYDPDTQMYYLTGTTGNDLELTGARTLDGLRADPDRRVVFQNETMISNTTVWAPEIHKLNGTWYIYYTHGSEPHVIGGGSSPFDEYSNPVNLDGKYGIDGTVLNVEDTPYFVWSCLQPLDGFNKSVQSLCISELVTPTQLNWDNVGVISQPDEPWEQQGNGFSPAIEEAPQALYWNNRTFLTYSANDCGQPLYSIGLLTFNGGDPTKAESWSKQRTGPVFSAANGNYGTAHNTIFYSPDGSEVWNGFHAVQSPKGACDNSRSTFAYKLNFTTDGLPIFGQPGYYGATLPGPSGEPNVTLTINNVRTPKCVQCWEDSAGKTSTGSMGNMTGDSSTGGSDGSGNSTGSSSNSSSSTGNSTSGNSTTQAALALS